MITKIDGQRRILQGQSYAKYWQNGIFATHDVFAWEIRPNDVYLGTRLWFAIEKPDFSSAIYVSDNMTLDEAQTIADCVNKISVISGLSGGEYFNRFVRQILTTKLP